MSADSEPVREQTPPPDWAAIGRSRELERDHDGAVAAYRTALNLNRSDGDAWFGLARVFRRMGQLDSAIVALEKAISLGPSNAARRYLLAQVLVSKKQWRLAARRFLEAACLAPGYWAAYHNLAACWEQTGELERAENVAAMAVALKADHWGTQIMLGKLRQALGHWAAAAAPLEAAIGLKPSDWHGHFALGFSRGYAMGWQRDGRILAHAVVCRMNDEEGTITDFAEAPGHSDVGSISKDCSILIPFLRDMDERTENIESVIKYINRTLPDVAIHVHEIGGTRHLAEHPGLRYSRDALADDRYVRVKQRNQMAREAVTPVIVLCDADILVPPEQMLAAIALVRAGAADLVLPYDGRCIDLERTAIADIGAGAPIETWRRHWHSLRPYSIGGICVWNRASFMAAGMENETFENWGQEDAERLLRALRLGLRVARVEGVIYHLNHPRGKGVRDPVAARAKAAAFERILAMSPDALRAHVAAWPWVAQS